MNTKFEEMQAAFMQGGIQGLIRVPAPAPAPAPAPVPVPVPTLEPVAVESSSYWQQAHVQGWDFANFSTKVAITSFGIATIRSPSSTINYRMSMGESALPFAKDGFKKVVQDLFAGSTSLWKGSAAKTTLLLLKPAAEATEAKGQVNKLAAEEGEVVSAKPVRANNQRLLSDMAYVQFVSIADIGVTQFHDAQAYLGKGKKLPEGFNAYTPHNAFRLMSSTFGSRYVSNLLSFSLFYIAEERFAETVASKCHTSEGGAVAHGIAGLATGLVTTAVTYPCSYFMDIKTSKTCVIDGLLINPSLKSLAGDFQQALMPDPWGATKGFLSNAARQVLFRSMTGSLICSVAALSKAMDPELLASIVPRLRPSTSSANNPHRMFAPSRPVQPVAVVESAVSIDKKDCSVSVP